MNNGSLWKSVFLASFLVLFFGFAFRTPAQQTLGGITGTVTDESGAAVPGADVTIVGDQTQLKRTQETNETGAYTFVNLPIGSYSIAITHAGFTTLNIPSIAVQANRTVTVNGALKVGEVATTVTVQETPLINAVDTTNGYVLDKTELSSIPLPTGSFTGIAILSPGVNAELSSGTGANAGLGNAPIWANGQRDTSNTFLLNGVDASNIFNGKSTSSVSSARVVNNTGLGGAAGLTSTSAEPIQSTSSVYLAIGQALPTPAPETIEEFRANTSMYDAQQGSTSGAHIDLSTASGTNDVHGQAYIHRGTNALNAASFFDNQNPNIPDAYKNPGLHRYTAGGTLGAPIIKNKLFGFIAYQHVRDSDQQLGTSRSVEPFNLTSDRSPNGLALADNSGDFPSPITLPATVGTGPGQINPIAYGLLNYRLPNGQFLIPSPDGVTPTINFPENTFTPGTAYFRSDQAVADLDYIVTSKDTLALKYYYQHDPSVAPYAYSASPGFTQNLDAGSQVASITNTQTLTPNFNVAEVFGFIREKVYSTIQQPFTPQQLSTYIQNLLASQHITGVAPADTMINTFGSTFFPGMSIVDDFGNDASYNRPGPDTVINAGTNIGDGAASQGAFTGVFQNRFMPSANAIWIHGKHTLTFGGSFSYTQLNARNERTNKGTIGFTDFSAFLTGTPINYTAEDYVTTTFLNGDANRYYRNRETGEYIQDKFQVRSNLSISLGLRFDYHGGLTEKNGELYNFDPTRYNYAAGENGLIIAANNKLFPSKGVSDSTLTGRQWGIAPRIGVAWSPKKFNDKVVVRAGWGMYYDRGELFTYLSPGFAEGDIPGGPFGVTQSPPYVNATLCSPYYYSTCTLEEPWGSTPPATPTGNPASLQLADLNDISSGLPLFFIGVYNRANKLPYTLNQTLDIQWQPRNDLAIDVGYVGNLGRHEVVPLPFNQAQIATASHPINGQIYSYGYSIVTENTSFPFPPAPLPDGSPYLQTFEGGNIDLRVPYLGYAAESERYTAAGVSDYNALQVHVEKRLSHGLQIGFSYTYSHSLDEQSALGLFYNGNNPLDLRSGYGNSDFDRPHVINFTYLYQLHNFASESSLAGKFVDGWAVEGLTILQSGQPFSVIDYTGAVGGLFYGTNDGIANPIVPLTTGAGGCTPKQAVTGYNGATPGFPALNANCFSVQPLTGAAAAALGVPSNDPYETDFISKGQRNIFRQAWQKRADISIVKTTKITERVSAKYTFDVFNLTNTPSFDIPIDNVYENIFYQEYPYVGQPATTKPCDTSFTALYVCPSLSGLGVTNKTIGSSRQIQMSLSVLF